MRKSIVMLLALVFGITLFLGALELDNKNLKGLNHTRIQCEFNNIPFFKAYKDTNAEKLEEFNLAELETNLTDSGLPLTKELLRTVYNHMETKLKKAGLRIISTKNDSEKNSATIIPTISIAFEVIEASEDSFAGLVYLTVSQWMSTWVGSQNISTPVIAWWQKKLLISSSAELNNTIEKASTEIIDDFIVQFSTANKDEESQPDQQENTQKK